MRAAVLAGVVGPVLFGLVLTTLTVVQYDFMLGIGWEPLLDPSGAWPSGLALAPYGWILDATFVLSGAMISVFAFGLHYGLPLGTKAGPALLVLSGAAMMLMAFETDPIRRVGPRSWHGLVHDAAFVAFALTLLLSLFFLSRRMAEDPRWGGHSLYTLATALCCAACLLLPDVAYYLFILAVLLWVEVTALKLYGQTGG